MEAQRGGRPRSKSGFSFHSDRSASTKGSARRKESLAESHDEKAKQHMSSTSKANPNAAMTEFQPIQAALEKSTMGSLRAGTYTDMYGNIITNPDPSNPTRRRDERPLETIRSFEAAIDGDYRRQHAHEYDAQSRRSSAHWGVGSYDQSTRTSTRPRDSYYESGPPPNPQRRLPGAARQQSDPQLARYGPGAVYPNPGYTASQATVNTGGSTGSDAWPGSNGAGDPGSENSSMERVRADDRYHATQGGIQEEGDYTYAAQQGVMPGNNQSGFFPPQGQGRGPHVDGPVMRQEEAPRRNVIKLGGGDGAPSPMMTGGQRMQQYEPVQRPSMGDEGKRKSWLKRRFSKN